MKKVSDQDIRCPVQCSDLLSHVRGLQDNRGFEREFRVILMCGFIFVFT